MLSHQKLVRNLMEQLLLLIRRRQVGSFFSSVLTLENTGNLPKFRPRCSGPLLETMVFTPILIAEKLRNWYASPRPDKVHSCIFAEACNSLCYLLVKLFQKSFGLGSLHKDWLVDSVAPVFKKGNRQIGGNYRPVRLTVVPCKVMEPIIRDSLLAHLEENNLLSRHQHGFRPK